MSTPALLAGVPKISVAGRQEAKLDESLVELRVEHEYRLPGQALLRLEDSGYALSSSDLLALGKQLKVEMRSVDRTAVDAPWRTVFDGVITGLTMEYDVDRPEVLLVHAREKGEALARGETVGTYLDRSADEVVRAIASRNGLSVEADSFPLRATYQLQLGNDLQMLDRLADEVGADWWLEAGTLRFARVERDPDGVVIAVPGRNLSRFETRATTAHPDGAAVSYFDPKQRKALNAAAPRARVATNGGGRFVTDARTPSQVLGGGKRTVRVTAESVRTQAQAEGRAQTEQARIDAGAVTATGTLTGEPAVVVGGTVKVDKAGPASGSYHVTRVEHLYRGTYTTRFTAGERRPRGLVDALRAPDRDTARLPGLVVGRVTSHAGAGAKADVDGVDPVGRVKVMLPSLGTPGGTELVSTWARVLALGADPKSTRGMVVLPEIGDDVLVGFENGDPRQPVVLGGLFSHEAGKAGFHPARDGKVQARRMTSRLGHELELADGNAPAQQHLALRVEGDEGHALRLGKDECTLTLPAAVPLKVKVGGATLTIANDKLTIDATGVKISSKTDLEIVAATGLKLSGLTVDVEAKSTATVKANAQLQLQATGPASLKGAVVQIN